jgi:catechol 2,3-dioxygenase-like lactoylglutathione lyase family enzyme
MSETTTALNGLGTELFAGIPVKEFKRSLEWYERLLGCPPNFFPNDREAVWAIAEHRWIYIIVQPEQAGGSVTTVICAELETLIDQIAARGIRFDKEERPAENVRKVMYFDPDGNEIGLGSVPAE